MAKNRLTDIDLGRMLPPITLTPLQEEVCKRLESFSQRTINDQDLVSIYKGALYSTRAECRSNPDWMAQSAHSLREILYLFKSKKTKGKKYNGNWIDAFRIFGSATTEEGKFQETVGRVYGKITNVAHHQLAENEDYYELVDEYQQVLLWALTRQVDVHEEIDAFLSNNSFLNSDE